MRWAGRQVAVQDSVAMARQVTGKVLRDGFIRDITALTLGLVRTRGNSLHLGPLELLRFGRPRALPTLVAWPIEGGLFARTPGGSFRIESRGGRLMASVDGYRPRLPLVLFAVTQLPVHHLVTRLHLLRVRGRQPTPGMPAAPGRRLAAAAIDLGLCATLAAASGRRHRVAAMFVITAGYHIACWSLSGRTLGGVLMGQRVVAIDGSMPTAGQAIVRLVALPAAALRFRALHDEAAGTEVIAN